MPMATSIVDYFCKGHYQIVMGLGLKFLIRVGSAIYGLGLNLENFP